MGSSDSRSIRMAKDRREPQAHPNDRIEVAYDYALCAWARHFNVSEQKVKEAVAAVGDRAGSVREHLARTSSAERPSGR
jgi:hypothetical protein